MANHDAVIDLMNDNARLTRTIDLLEKNARVQAKLLADTGRQRDALVVAAERVCWFDWSDNDRDAATAVEELRRVLAALVGGEKL